MEYLLAWRMALAKNLLRRKEANVAQVAAPVSLAARLTATQQPSGLPSPWQHRTCACGDNAMLGV